MDLLFQADPQLRSVIVRPDRYAPALVNRSDFYQVLTGRRGYGWSLYSARPVSAILDLLPPPLTMPAERSLVDAGLALLAHQGLNAGDDVLVMEAGGEVSQIAVSSILVELARAYAAMTEQATTAEIRFRALLHGSSDVIGVVDADANITYLSAAAERVIGYPIGERVGRPAFDLLHGDDAQAMRALFQAISAQPEAEGNISFRLLRRDGEWRRMEGQARNLLHDEAVQGIVVNFRDVTERHTMQEELRHQAFHDSLTGLPNRQLLEDRAQQMMDRSRRTAQACAALLIDLDGFKDVNDMYGHGAGDLLLSLVAERLRLSLHESDTVGRLGGDEFVVLVEGTSLDGGPEGVAEKIIGAFRAPFDIQGRSVSITASVGVAIGAVGDREDAGDLLRDADIALYQAKGAGKNRYALFAPTMKEAMVWRNWLSSELPGALERGEFLLHYQPVFDLFDGDVCEVEALLRWDHPMRGIIPPGDFVGALEQSGLIVPVGRWVLAESCRVGASLAAEGHSCSMAVNVSGRQLAEEGQLYADVFSALETSGLPADRLTLEITESILMRDADFATRQLRRLKGLGVHLAIDDFGTGYSSLAYLASFPIDALKVDRSFIANLGRSREAECLLESVLNLGRALSLVTVAEGIEEDGQLAILRRQGCQVGQGFHMGRPQPEKELRQLLRAQRLRLSDVRHFGTR